MTDVWAWPVALGVLGLIFGSFIATIVVRWPQGRSVSKGRSHCDACNRVLGPSELVPVLSYAWLRGKCAGCGAAIQPTHLIVELLALAIGIASGIAAPGPVGASGAVFGWLLLALGALDLTAFWLPNIFTGALAAMGLATGLLGIDPPLIDRIAGGIGGYGTLWIVATLYRAIRKRVGLGGGDPKLFGAIGLWLGWQALPMVLLAACLIGLSAVLGLYLGGRKPAGTDRLPLGSMLAFAAWVVWLGSVIPLAPDAML